MTSIFQRCDQKSGGCWRKQALSKALRWAWLPSSWWYQASAPSPFIWRWAMTLLQRRYAHKGSVASSCGGFICIRNTHVVFVPDSTHSSTGFHCGCCFQFHDLCPQSHTPGSQVAVRRCCRHQKVSGECGCAELHYFCPKKTCEHIWWIRNCPESAGQTWLWWMDVCIFRKCLLRLNQCNR